MWGDMNGLALMKEFGTAGAICGSCLVALRVPVSGYGFVFYLLSSILWLWAAVLTQEWELATMQAAFTIINVVGIVRWLGPKVRNQRP